jgi:hypothetical protein
MPLPLEVAITVTGRAKRLTETMMNESFVAVETVAVGRSR